MTHEQHQTIPPDRPDVDATYIKRIISRGNDDFIHGRTTKQSEAAARPVPWKRTATLR